MPPKSSLFLGCGNLIRTTPDPEPEVDLKLIATVLKSYAAIENHLFAPGTEEFIHGPRIYARLTGLAPETIFICGNLEKPRPGFRKYFLYAFKDRKILVTSLLDPELERSPVSGVAITPPEQALKRLLAVPHDLAIVVFHLPDQRVREIIAQKPGLEIAILANRRGIIHKPEMVAGCCLLKDNDRGRTLGCLDWSLARQSPVKLNIIRLNPRTYRPDPETRKRVSKFEKWRDQYVSARARKKQKKDPEQKSDSPPLTQKKPGAKDNAHRNRER